MAVVTVLFRPFPHEATNVGMLLASAESMALAFVMIVWRRRVLAALRSFRRAPFTAFALTYVLLFCAAFASIGNFGILARQRTLMVPALVALLIGGGVRRAERIAATSR